jgi:arabinose-5-phosphate isomerase
VLSGAVQASQKAKPGPARDLDSARRVFRLEAEGIQALMRALDGPLGQSLTRAVDVIRAAGGRVIVTGMGKSGHVARKIAATLASVGTPAQFVHPAEASHGDLGMIAKNDAVLALSNSGETAELDDLVAYCKRFSIPLIAFTGRAGSALADAADVALLMPPAAEACPLGLAPTTSTTMMLALGDAIAVALLERNGFTAEHFQVLHPGGKLGRHLLRVSDLMDTGEDIPLASPGTIMSEVILIMTAKRHGCCGIADADGRLVGIITDGDLRRHMDGQLLARSAAEVMTKNPQTIRPEAFAAEALGLMNARKITTLFAVRDGRPVGFLYMHALLRAGVA